MPSSYSSSLRLTLPADGELLGTWGSTVNTGVTSLVDSAVAGYATVVMGAADYTLSSTNGAADEARKMMINITGVPGAARSVICPLVSKLYFVKNGVTGGYAVTFKATSGTGISIPNGASMVLLCDGTNVIEAVSNVNALTASDFAYTGTLTGGTGVVNLGSGQFYKDASGNVGIGSTAPVANLEVKSASWFPRVAFTKASSGTWYAGGDGANVTSNFQIGLNANTFVTLDTGGMLGIGGVPNYKLDVLDSSSAIIRARTTGSGNEIGRAHV